MLVFITATFAVLVGITGLAVDLGFVTIERRTLQKAADAAAVSGALDLAYETTWPSINTDVNAMVTNNQVEAGTTTACTLVDNSNAQRQANCNPPTDTNVSGVKVVLSRPRDTYFMRILGINTVNVSANSTARVVKHNAYEGGNALFMVCAYNTYLAPNGALRQSILAAGGPPYSVLPAALNRQYLIHGPQVQREDCGITNNAFKGLANADENEGLTTLPGVMTYDTGVKAGPTRTAVEGALGCGLIADSRFITTPCVMILPVFVSSPANKKVDAVMWLPFLIQQIDANTHYGTLISDQYLLRLETTNTSNWTVADPGLISPRLVN